jgi:hypothetical protein
MQARERQARDTMPTTNNEKIKPVEENTNVLYNVELDRRLMQEINLLKLEGLLFCFDPKEARRRQGVHTLTDALKRPISLTIHPSFGQPCVLAYKILQAIFIKIYEQGCELTEDGKCLYNDTVSFSHRELVELIGRSWSGSKISEEIYRAIKQLQHTEVNAYFYGKEIDTWELRSVMVLYEPLFAGRGKTITRFSVRVADKVIKSINQKHIAFFNLQRLNQLDTIGLAIYKRLFFHFSNLMHERKAHRSLKFTKDYDAIRNEWLGGLKPCHYRADIVKQLGRHLDALIKTGLIQRFLIEKNKAGDGFNLTFFPGASFFEDYEAYYSRLAKPQRIANAAQLREVKALELVAYFHRQLGRAKRTRFADHETTYADDLLATHTEAEIRDLIDYTIAEAKRTNWPDMLYLGACKRFVDAWSAGAARRKERERREAAVAECPHCTKDGWLQLREQATSQVVMHLCPHRLEHITQIEEGLKAYRV